MKNEVCTEEEAMAQVRGIVHEKEHDRLPPNSDYTVNILT